MNSFEIIVLCGGTSRERDVSVISGRMVHEGLEASFPGKVSLIELTDNCIPPGLDPERHVIFPALHGMFGEDGELQQLLEEAGFAYAGSGVEASRACMNKVVARQIAANSGIAVAPGTSRCVPPSPRAEEILVVTGEQVIIKPVAEGSSIGLHFVDGRSALEELLPRLEHGAWLFEKRIIGRETSVGILDGKALGVVEITPTGGVYDYEHKYTSGMSAYTFPAELPEAITRELKVAAESIFTRLGCRDFARADFLLERGTGVRFMEINTIPGLTPTSLLPKSASCLGIDYRGLVRRMIEPALRRFAANVASTPLP